MPSEPKADDEPEGVWIRPRSNVKGPGKNLWMSRIDSNSRWIELADIALGLKKPAPHKKKPAASAHDLTKKKEPYKKL